MTVHVPPVRTILRLNAAISTATGAAVFLSAGPLARALGISHRGWVAGAGILLFLYGLPAFAVSVRRGIGRAHVLPFVFADAAWFVATLGLLVLAPQELSVPGRAAVALLGAAGGLFAAAQYGGARALD